MTEGSEEGMDALEPNVVIGQAKQGHLRWTPVKVTTRVVRTVKRHYRIYALDDKPSISQTVLATEREVQRRGNESAS